MNGATTIDAVGIADILKALPHRYPFLLVDRITQVCGDDFAVGIKNVSVNEPQFQGHFPGNPVFPGVLILEGMAQFRKPVTPGDVMEYHVTKIKHRRNMWWYRGEAKVGGHVVAEAELGAMIADA
jgi:3-hydroxyacyl-[acyl-carrier-protein] dehydratase